jgi:hypothetical protein
MELRTTFSIPPSERKITYSGKVMFIGSCFATSIGRQFETGHLPVMINPSGTVYNPVSVLNTLDGLAGGRKFTLEDLYNHKGTWISFSHYTDFSSEDPGHLLERINTRSEEAAEFLAGAGFLFVTFGTARVYRWKRTGAIVSNCHKVSASEFDRELLKPGEIVSLWTRVLDRLQSDYPQLRIVFTISPVRHWKDGAHGNQVSKSVLFLAVEELLGHPSRPGYFPAYELLMDDLRDYRFYDEDMLHPSSPAVSYIWDAFSDCYFDNNTRSLWKEISGISKAMSHRLKKSEGESVRKFAVTTIEKIDSLVTRVPGLDLEKEKMYFLSLLES